jgi:hypothetical protein
MKCPTVLVDGPWPTKKFKENATLWIQDVQGHHQSHNNRNVRKS